MFRTSFLLVMGVGVCAAPTGCGTKPDPIKPGQVPAYVRGTVGEQAGYAGAVSRLVQGYGVVIGLGENGSAEIAPTVRQYLVRELRLQNLGSSRYGTRDLHPNRILRDLDTGVVLVAGQIPRGAPVGSRFDVQIGAEPHTRSLDGGMLMPAKLRLAWGPYAVPGAPTRPWAMAGGEIFVDPFVDPSKPAERNKLLKARIIGGGKVTRSHRVRLVLHQPNPAGCALIRNRINQSELLRDAQGDVATGKSSTMIELRIPSHFRNDYEHFLELVLRLPLRQSPGAAEMRTRELLKAMRGPKAPHDELALALEAMGRQAVPMIQAEYTCEDAHAAFYCARAALRLGDQSASETILRLAESPGSPVRIPAIEEIGRHGQLVEAMPLLRRLLDDESELVRVAAYEALARHDDRVRIRPIRIGKRFRLDLVRSRGRPVIYATQTGRPRIALFGQSMPISQPVFFSLPDDLITLSNVQVDNTPKLMVYRKIPRGNTYSPPFHTDFTVASLIRTLGSPAERDDQRKIQGLALTYSQVLRVLYGMCKAGDIKARFVLQRPPAYRRIFRGAEMAGRPEAPES